VDKIIDIYPTEYLNTIDISNRPPHESNLEVGAPVILLWNLDPLLGTCNGTRMRVVNVSTRLCIAYAVPGFTFLAVLSLLRHIYRHRKRRSAASDHKSTNGLGGNSGRESTEEKRHI
jgi:PIF1-like helicase